MKQENKQSKLKHFIGAPRRLLRKARDFYVDSMFNIDGKVGYCNVQGGAAPMTHAAPRNFAPSSTITNDCSDRLRVLIRSVSERGSVGSKVEIERRESMAGHGRLDRSFSIGLGRIGTIEEERSYEFEEEGIELKSDFLFTRSRSCAVTNRYASY